jgi:integrase
MRIGGTIGGIKYPYRGDTTKMSLTDTQCKSAKPKVKAYKLGDSQGLYLHVMPNGAKYWRWRYRFFNKQKLLAIGVYPEVSLQEAREARDKAKKLLASGADPSFTKQQRKQIAALNAENTFEAIAREWHSNHLELWSSNYAKNVLHRLDVDIFPSLKGRPISAITPLELMNVLKKIERRGVGEIAHRLLAVCGQIFRYAIATERSEKNPAADLKGALKPRVKSHFAALDIKDIPAFVHKLDNNDACLHISTRHAVKLMLHTFVRTSELINAEWTEFDFEGYEWIIPAERMKMRVAHIVPLSRQVAELFKAQKEVAGNSIYVFPNRNHPKKTMSNNTILKALSLLGYKGKATGHGFRALAMTAIKEKLGYRHEVVDRQLAHGQKDKVAAAYDRAQFLDERVKMMQEWSDYLDAIVAKERNKVVNLRP